ncbi:hypothetical protein [Micromonospora sp. NPDC049301]|uniref:hypothetical protein n=1 Tax=Micromonospora sp. NPDC049301 TaxID=3155723 RepID=UPI00343327FB
MEVRFRRSSRRLLGRIACVGLVIMSAFALVGVIAFDNSWYDFFPHGPMLLLGAVGFTAQLRRQGGLPLRLTRDFLELTLPGGAPVRIDWPDVALAEVRGRLGPILVVDVADPERTRPVLSRWEWGRLGMWDMTRVRRPHEIHVSLIAVTPDVRRLRAELAHRLGRSAGDVPADSDG